MQGPAAHPHSENEVNVKRVKNMFNCVLQRRGRGKESLVSGEDESSESRPGEKLLLFVTHTHRKQGNKVQRHRIKVQ